MNRLAAGIAGCVTILALLSLAPAAWAQGRNPQQPGRGLSPQQVEQGIQLAVRYLTSHQLDDGGWPEYNAMFPDGVSALVTLALLNSGLPPEQPQVAKALQFLSRRELSRTYTVSLQTMVFCAANPNQYAPQIVRNAQWLADAQLANGGWTYGKDEGAGDPSNSQFALLALHEAQRSGVANLPADTWRTVFGRAQKYWYGLQNKDGSFPYSSNGNGTGSMTCAGIASLVIVGAQLDGLDPVALDTVQCCGADSSGQERIDAAARWLGDNFSVMRNPNDGTQLLYYIYALERVGRMTGRRFIGGADWYRQGAQQLLQLQERISGRVVGANAYHGTEHTETAFALLFLSKGKRQTVINRLHFGESDDWRQHPSAIQNLTSHVEQAWKRELAWQNIELDKASVEDLLESPVLFLSGSRAPNLTPAHKRLLYEYVEQGGFLFVEASHGNGCNGKEFEAYFTALVKELWQQPLEKLPPEHPIWFAESRVTPADLPDDAWLYGIQTCCRLGVVYCPISLACRWELNQPYGIKPQFTAAVQQELDVSSKIGVNVISYATGRELKQKLETVTVLEEVRNELPSDRGVFLLPKLRHNAGFDDAPRALANLVSWMDKENPFQLSSQRRLLEITPQQLESYPVVFMHGRGELRLTELQRSALREYFQHGGFLFADAICADEAFAKSFRREMAIILEEPLSNLPATHDLLTRNYYGFDIRQVNVIDPDLSGDSILAAQRRIAPRLEAGRMDSRIAVIFSPLDISCALESRHSLQCRGYTREDAARVGINVVLYALQRE